MSRPRTAYWLAVALTATGLLVLGTRTGTIGALTVPLLVAALNYRRYLAARRFPIAVALAIVLAGVIVAVAAGQIERITAEPYQLRKYQRLAAGEFTRMILLAGAIVYVTERELVADIIGDGASRYQKGVAEASGSPEGRDLAEVDWMDLYGAHGIVFLGLLLAFYGMLVFNIAEMGKLYGRPMARCALLCVLLYLVHAMLAGHALSGPLPSGVVAPILAFGWVRGHRATQVIRREEKPFA